MMLRTISQSIPFPASAKQLYTLLITPKLHAAFTGAPVTISPKPGSKFAAFGGQLTGMTLSVIPGKLIIQRWRSTHWKKNDLDSILIIRFVDEGKRGRIDLVHVNVPEH